MAMYFNPKNRKFIRDSNDKFYVDKTGVLAELNDMIDTPNGCVSLSHARRFGKTQVANMLDAYYSSGCDSREIFERFEIASNPTFEKHLNKYNVIHWDVATITDICDADVVPEMIKSVYEDMGEVYPDLDYSRPLFKNLYDVYNRTGKEFVIIIDEWDCVIRNYSNQPELVHKYMQFLHSLFKSSESAEYLALGYITGILPIKKIADESALNNFREYTMINSKNLTRYYGFTEEEVHTLCEQSGMSFEDMKVWYNGYLINGIHMYNPNSVNQAINSHSIDEYWKNTSAYDVINQYITLNFDGLKDAIVSILAGKDVHVNTGNFRNDLSQIRSKDDALTALIHLGYLGYNEKNGCAYLPNYEVRSAFNSALADSGWESIAASIMKSDKLLAATISGDAAYVSEALETAHEAYSSILKYNDENSLACVLTMAYSTIQAHYMVFREMPAGKGFADLVFIPRASSGDKPAIIIELKFGKSAQEALDQIKNKHYYECLSGYEGAVVLVGINYDRDTKKHACVIEKYASLGCISTVKSESFMN